MVTNQFLCELGHINTSVAFVLNCETWQKVSVVE